MMNAILEVNESAHTSIQAMVCYVMLWYVYFDCIWYVLLDCVELFCFFVNGRVVVQ